MDIRPAAESDLPAVTAIYNDAVARTTGTFDTTARTLAEQNVWFAAHGASRPVLVAVEAGKVLGWASLSEYSGRCAYSRTAEVSVYVDEGARGKGCGGRLLDAVLEAGRAAGVKEVIARIAEGNEVSLALHRKRGFDEVGRLRKVGEKFGRLLDVHFLQKSLAALLLALLLPSGAAAASVEDAVRESALSLAGGDVARARQQADAAVKADPRSSRAWQQLAAAAIAGQDHAAGRDAAERAVALAGETPALLVLRAQGAAGWATSTARWPTPAARCAWRRRARVRAWSAPACLKRWGAAPRRSRTTNAPPRSTSFSPRRPTRRARAWFRRPRAAARAWAACSRCWGYPRSSAGPGRVSCARRRRRPPLRRHAPRRRACARRRSASSR